jgi:hypothetical protein
MAKQPEPPDQGKKPSEEVQGEASRPAGETPSAWGVPRAPLTPQPAPVFPNMSLDDVEDAVEAEEIEVEEADVEVVEETGTAIPMAQPVQMGESPSEVFDALPIEEGELIAEEVIDAEPVEEAKPDSDVFLAEEEIPVAQIAAPLDHAAEPASAVMFTEEAVLADDVAPAQPMDSPVPNARPPISDVVTGPGSGRPGEDVFGAEKIKSPDSSAVLLEPLTGDLIEASSVRPAAGSPSSIASRGKVPAGTPEDDVLHDVEPDDARAPIADEEPQIVDETASGVTSNAEAEEWPAVEQAAPASDVAAEVLFEEAEIAPASPAQEGAPASDVAAEALFEETEAAPASAVEEAIPASNVAAEVLFEEAALAAEEATPASDIAADVLFEEVEEAAPASAVDSAAPASGVAAEVLAEEPLPASAEHEATPASDVAAGALIGEAEAAPGSDVAPASAIVEADEALGDEAVVAEASAVQQAAPASDIAAEALFEEASVEEKPASAIVEAEEALVAEASAVHEGAPASDIAAEALFEEASVEETPASAIVEVEDALGDEALIAEASAVHEAAPASDIAAEALFEEASVEEKPVSAIVEAEEALGDEALLAEASAVDEAAPASDIAAEAEPASDIVEAEEALGDEALVAEASAAHEGAPASDIAAEAEPASAIAEAEEVLDDEEIVEAAPESAILEADADVFEDDLAEAAPGAAVTKEEVAEEGTESAILFAEEEALDVTAEPASAEPLSAVDEAEAVEEVGSAIEAAEEVMEDADEDSSGSAILAAEELTEEIEQAPPASAVAADVLPTEAEEASSGTRKAESVFEEEALPVSSRLYDTPTPKKPGARDKKSPRPASAKGADATVEYEPAAPPSSHRDPLVTEEESPPQGSSVQLGDLPAGSSISSVDPLAEELESGVGLQSPTQADAGKAPSVEFDEILDDLGDSNEAELLAKPPTKKADMEGSTEMEFEAALLGDLDEPVGKKPKKKDAGKKDRQAPVARTGDDIDRLEGEAEALSDEADVDAEVQAAEALADDADFAQMEDVTAAPDEAPAKKGKKKKKDAGVKKEKKAASAADDDDIDLETLFGPKSAAADAGDELDGSKTNFEIEEEFDGSKTNHDIEAVESHDGLTMDLSALEAEEDAEAAEADEEDAEIAETDEEDAETAEADEEDAEAEAAEADEEDAEDAEAAEADEEDAEAEAAEADEEDVEAPISFDDDDAALDEDEEAAEAESLDEDDMDLIDDDEKPAKKSKLKGPKKLKAFDDEEDETQDEDEEEDLDANKKQKGKKGKTVPAPAQKRPSLVLHWLASTFLVTLLLGGGGAAAWYFAGDMIEPFAKDSPSWPKPPKITPQQKSKLELARASINKGDFNDAIDKLKESTDLAELSARGEAKWLGYFKDNKETLDRKAPAVTEALDDLKKGQNQLLQDQIDVALKERESKDELGKAKDAEAKAQKDLATLKAAKEKSDDVIKGTVQALVDGKVVPKIEDVDPAGLPKKVQELGASKSALDEVNKSLKEFEIKGEGSEGVKEALKSKKENDDKLAAVNKVLDNEKVKGKDAEGVQEIAKERTETAKDRDDLDSILKAAFKELVEGKIVPMNDEPRKQIVDGVKLARQKAESPLSIPLTQLGAALGSIGTGTGSAVQHTFDLAKVFAELGFYTVREPFIQKPEQKLDTYIALLQDREFKDAGKLAEIGREVDWLLSDKSGALDEARGKARLVQGLALRNQEKFPEAKAALAEALKLAQTIEKPGAWSQDAGRAQEELTNPGAYYLKKMDRLQSDGDFKSALSEANLALKAMPDEALLFARRGLIRLEMVRGQGANVPAEIQKAIRDDAQAVLKNEKLADESSYVEGLLEQELGNLKRAEQMYRKAIEQALALHKDEPERKDRYLVALGKLLLRERAEPAPAAAPDNNDEKQKEEKKADKVGAVPVPRETVIYMHPWSLLIVSATIAAQPAPEEVDDPEALARFKEVEKIAKDLIDSKNKQIKGQGHLMLGQAYSKLGRRTEGLKEIARGLELLYAGDATKELSRMIAEHPAFSQPDVTNNPNPVLAERHYGEGLHHYWAKEYPQAEAQFKQAVRYFNQDARYQYFLGLAQLAQKSKLKRDAAIFSFEQGARIEARNPGAIREINLGLERIQGELRQQLNSYRYKALTPTVEGD